MRLCNPKNVIPKTDSPLPGPLYVLYSGPAPPPGKGIEAEFSLERYRIWLLNTRDERRPVDTT